MPNERIDLNANRKAATANHAPGIAITLIADIDRPPQGFMDTKQQPLQDLLDAI